MGNWELNGPKGRADIFVFNDVFEDTKKLLINDNCIFIKGTPSDRSEDDGALKLIAKDVFPLAQVRENLSHHINVMIDSMQNDDYLLNTLKDVSSKNKGSCGLIIHLKAENGALQRIRASKIGVNASKIFIQNLRDIFGKKHIWIS